MEPLKTASEVISLSSLKQGVIHDSEKYNISGEYTVACEDSDDNLYKLFNVNYDSHRFVLRFYAEKPRFWGGTKKYDTLSEQVANCISVLSLEERERHTRTGDFINLSVPRIRSIKSFAISKPSSRYYYWHNHQFEVAFETEGEDLLFGSKFLTAENILSIKVDEKLNYEVSGRTFSVSTDHFTGLFYRSYRDKTSSSKVSLDLSQVSGLTSYFKNQSNIEAVMKGVIKQRGTLLTELDKKGITKAMSKVEPFYEEILESEPLLVSIFRTFVQESKRTIDSVKVSTIFNEMFQDVKSLEEFKAVLQEIAEKHSKMKYYSFDSLFKEMSGFSEKRKAALKSKATGAFSKMMADLEFVDIDSEKYPLTYQAITDGELPLSTFFRKSESYFLFNDNWALWEEMLEKHRDIAIELAQTVKSRTTYEKDLMSYMYFTLYALPEYLEKQTGKKWTGIPKLVNSSSELDPPKEEGGTAKRRSALTPIVDNDANTVTVPYASLAMSGSYGTTYCYSLNYNVLHRGLSIGGNVCMKDVEEKLNGRDDYGLMFYTLTGSAAGRGYPTFLIIFERLENDNTRVHFHRTHPMRSKDGDYNPIHQWTKGCYKWMVGNVNYDRIVAQQGDLVFVKTEFDESKMDFFPVNSFDNHRFEKEVLYAEYDKAKKDNILGYFKIEEDINLLHNEHLQRLIPAGTYELRQCRSWEANPKGVWSLRID